MPRDVYFGYGSTWQRFAQASHWAAMAATISGRSAAKSFNSVGSFARSYSSHGHLHLFDGFWRWRIVGTFILPVIPRQGCPRCGNHGISAQRRILPGTDGPVPEHAGRKRVLFERHRGADGSSDHAHSRKWNRRSGSDCQGHANRRACPIGRRPGGTPQCFRDGSAGGRKRLCSPATVTGGRSSRARIVQLQGIH